MTADNASERWKISGDDSDQITVLPGKAIQFNGVIGARLAVDLHNATCDKLDEARAELKEERERYAEHYEDWTELAKTNDAAYVLMKNDLDEARAEIARLNESLRIRTYERDNALKGCEATSTAYNRLVTQRIDEAKGLEVAPISDRDRIAFAVQIAAGLLANPYDHGDGTPMFGDPASDIANRSLNYVDAIMAAARKERA